ncbi:hypothetical protein F4778DRAFT_100543 [Xylariomycetidae sp. FL2044]|nr:hypothetical protein F4778DRAFT_100543 [Xylariomycetidae sp. FL2044]
MKTGRKPATANLKPSSHRDFCLCGAKRQLHDLRTDVALISRLPRTSTYVMNSPGCCLKCAGADVPQLTPVDLPACWKKFPAKSRFEYNNERLWILQQRLSPLSIPRHPQHPGPNCTLELQDKHPSATTDPPTSTGHHHPPERSCPTNLPPCLQSHLVPKSPASPPRAWSSHGKSRPLATQARRFAPDHVLILIPFLLLPLLLILSLPTAATAAPCPP